MNLAEQLSFKKSAQKLCSGCGDGKDLKRMIEGLNQILADKRLDVEVGFLEKTVNPFKEEAIEL